MAYTYRLTLLAKSPSATKLITEIRLLQSEFNYKSILKTRGFLYNFQEFKIMECDNRCPRDR